MMRVERHGLQVDPAFADFIEERALPGTGVDADRFWRGLSDIAHDLGPENAALLKTRAELQRKIDAWHIDQRGRPFDADAYQAMLRGIGYIVPDCGAFTVSTSGIDPEIASIAGPQLVVPVTNARFAVNAANARWNSLYDALYGTDALGSPPPEGGYDKARGSQVVSWSRAFLDRIFPLEQGSHDTAAEYSLSGGRLSVLLDDGSRTELRYPEQFVGFIGNPDDPAVVLLRNNGLHVEIRIDRSHPVGAMDAAGIADIVLESAVTTIMDCEDSVATVDAEDKILAYGNWLGLMKGDIKAEFTKDGAAVVRRLSPDRNYWSPEGLRFTLNGLSLQLVRNVGLLMTSPAALDSSGNEIFEGLLDAMCTIAIALHDIRGARRNSPQGSVYVVKPKLHGPEETAFSDRVFGRVEQWLELPPNTVKIGIMDEERRTTVNLKECMRASVNRVAFINTGFLDRTGDEIHTSMEAGSVMRKSDIKSADWIAAYEDWNTETGIACGLVGKGQIGKGMWAMPDLMQEMLKQKIGHPMAGANTAWVPSPAAAVLHATHYHSVNVADRQREIAADGRQTRLERILAIPLTAGAHLSGEEIRAEVENNLQGVLGYVVRWVDQGIGCSKVPDRQDVQLMEDRATCRISSQHVVNWLHHGIIDRNFVEAALRRMAEVVDRQNRADPAYRPMAPDFDGPAFNAARTLVLDGRLQPSGYTEPILHRFRAEAKRKPAVRRDAGLTAECA